MKISFSGRRDKSMDSFFWLIILLISLIMFLSVFQFIRGSITRFHTPLKDSKFSTELFYTLLIIYIIVLIGFGLIYFLLSIHRPILITLDTYSGISNLEKLLQAFYFSGVTLLTIGYGDIAPIGIGRAVAVIQALVGYILPTAFVLRIVGRERK